MSVHFSPFPPKGTADIVAVYRELLKTHKPSQIAMFGLSGGCQMAANTTIYMASQKLPMPGALGLFTCAGGSMPGDTRVTMNGGLDPFLSDFARTGSIGGRTQGSPRAAAKPGDPPQEILLADIPKGFPPSYLVTGTRDMCLSHMAVLHRKLRAAGVEADLNVFEGAWHGATADPTLPEARDAQTDFFHFLDKHLGT
jgi:acetyl esterase/lipase